MDILLQQPQYNNDSPLLREIRRRGLEAFQKQGLPTAKTEAWKYTKLRDLKADDYCCSSVGAEVGSIAFAAPFDCWQIDIVQGYVVRMPQNIPGVEILPVTQNASGIGAVADAEEHPFAALSEYCLDSGLFLRISGKLDKPVWLNSHVFAGEKNYLCNLRNLIVCDENSSAEIIETYTYSGEVKSRYLMNVVNEISIGQNAVLKHCKYQNEAFKANHIALNSVSVAANGVYNSFCLQKGANIARNETEVFLCGEAAETKVDAAYMMNGWATLDTTTNIFHKVPHTKSFQLIKGVIGGDARGVFQGKIHIAPNAVNTEGNQLHKALLLSDNAEIDVKPELEIFADDVKCSHGAASGELDEEQLFYMQSRGIGREEARKLLIEAYLDDAFAQIENENIRGWFKSLS